MSGDFKRRPFRFDFDPPEDPNFVVADPFTEEPAQLNAEELAQNPEIKPSQVVRVLDYLYGRSDDHSSTSDSQNDRSAPRHGKLNWF